MAGMASKPLALLTKGKQMMDQWFLPFLMRGYLWTCFQQTQGKEMVQLSCGEKQQMRRSQCVNYLFYKWNAPRVWSLLVVCCLGTFSAEFLSVLLPSLGPISSCNNPISSLSLGTPRRVVLRSLGLLSLERKVTSSFSHRVQELCVSLATPAGQKSETTVSPA